MVDDKSSAMQAALTARFADAPDGGAVEAEAEALTRMAARGSCRAFADRAVPEDVLAVLQAVALASPTKSDLQQRDIIVLKSPDVRARLAELVSGQGWVAEAPMLLVFCGNNRRQRLLHDWHGIPFANDHADAVINAVGDAAIAMGAFVTAAEALGLGCCPISAVRNRAEEVSDLLGLPDHVFPFAGLALGYPAEAAVISKRLPLSVTCHVDRYCEEGLRSAVEAYDEEREAAQPYGTQRSPERFGTAAQYGWSLDKVRQYALPERAGFGRYLRARGFLLE